MPPHGPTGRPTPWHSADAGAVARMLREAFGDGARAEALHRAWQCERDRNRVAVRLWLDAWRELVVEDASNP